MKIETALKNLLDFTTGYCGGKKCSPDEQEAYCIATHDAQTILDNLEKK